jgi:hypothetical protein
LLFDEELLFDEFCELLCELLDELLEFFDELLEFCDELACDAFCVELLGEEFCDELLWLELFCELAEALLLPPKELPVIVVPLVLEYSRGFTGLSWPLMSSVMRLATARRIAASSVSSRPALA